MVQFEDKIKKKKRWQYIEKHKIPQAHNDT